MKKLLVTLITILLFVMLGCAALQDEVTPCYVEGKVADYVKDADPNYSVKMWLPFTTLGDSKRLKSYFDYQHIENQVSLSRLMEDDNRFYDFATDRFSLHQQNSLELQSVLFSPEGLGILFPTILAGAFGALAIKRPGDKSPKEVADTLYTEEEVEKIKNGKDASV